MSRAEPNFIMMAEAENTSPVDQLRRRALRLMQEAEEAPENDARRPYQGFAAPAAAGPVKPEPARAFAVGVVTMPAVFIVVVMGALALFGKPASEPGPQAQTAAIDTLDQPARGPATDATFASSKSAPAISLGEDRRVRSISLDGDRVAMHVESPMGDEIVVYDFVSKRVVATAPIVSASLDSADQLAAITGAPPPVVNLAIVAPAVEPLIESGAANAPVPPTMKPKSAE
ncbi:MAG: hypothetical protein AAB227_09915 [Pseudomonadota bacterium]